MRIRRVIIEGTTLEYVSPNAFLSHGDTAKTSAYCRIVDLNSNRIARVYAGTFAPLTSLRDLYLQNNRIAVVDGTAFTGLARLRRLSLNANRIVHLPGDDWLRGTDRVWYLRLGHNRLTELPDRTLVGKPNVWRVELDANRLRWLPRGLAANSSVQQFSVSGNALTELRPEWFKGMSGLRELHAENNEISTVDGVDFGVNSFGGEFTTLELSGNPLECDCRLTGWMNNGSALNGACYWPAELRNVKVACFLNPVAEGCYVSNRTAPVPCSDQVSIVTRLDRIFITHLVYHSLTNSIR